MKQLYIDYDAESVVIEDTQGENGPNTGHCETETSLSVKGLYRSSPETIGTDIRVSDDCFDVKIGYLVVVRYSTGSTNGSERGAYKFVAVFSDADNAEKLSKEIKKQNKKYGTQRTGFTFKPKTKSPNFDSGILYCSWNGYFERLQDVEIHSLRIKD